MGNLLELVHEDFGSKFVCADISKVEFNQLKHLTLQDLNTNELVGLAKLQVTFNSPDYNSKLMKEAGDRILDIINRFDPFMKPEDVKVHYENGWKELGNGMEFSDIIETAYMRRLGRLI
jgi:hypothetical protein